MQYWIIFLNKYGSIFLHLGFARKSDTFLRIIETSKAFINYQAFLPKAIVAGLAQKCVFTKIHLIAFQKSSLNFNYSAYYFK